MLKVGLRFRRGDARVLDTYAQRVRNGEIVGSVDTFEQAADAARKGEPLIVICTEPDEAHLMAGMYASLGLQRPSVEAISGD